MLRKVLELEFLDKANNTFKIKINDPKDDLEEMDIMDAMDTILEKNIFNSKTNDLFSKKSARVIETTVSVMEF